MNYLMQANKKCDGEVVIGYYAKVRDYLNEEDIHIIIPETARIIPYEGINEWEIIDETTLCKYEKAVNNLSERMVSYMEREYGKRFVAEQSKNYFLFCTGTNEYGFEFAVSKDNLEALEKENPWNVKTINGIVSICCAKNNEEINQEALKLWDLLTQKGISREWYERKEEFTDNTEYCWLHFSDGSGRVYNKKDEFKKPLITYDRTTISNGVEYETRNGWKDFYGTFDEFKNYISNEIERIKFI